MNELTDDQMDAMSHVELVGELIKATEEEITTLVTDLGSEIGAISYSVAIAMHVHGGDSFIRSFQGKINPRVTLTEDV